MKKCHIRNNIRELRARGDGLTQQELADSVGVTRQTVVAIEKAKYSPSLEVAFRIADRLDVNIDDVFQFETAGRLTAGVVDGGAGTDTLDGDLNSNDFVISGTDTGTYDSDQASGGEVVFVNVESLDGRSGNTGSASRPSES